MGWGWGLSVYCGTAQDYCCDRDVSLKVLEEGGSEQAADSRINLGMLPTLPSDITATAYGVPRVSFFPWIS